MIDKLKNLYLGKKSTISVQSMTSLDSYRGQNGLIDNNKL